MKLLSYLRADGAAGVGAVVDGAVRQVRPEFVATAPAGLSPMRRVIQAADGAGADVPLDLGAGPVPPAELTPVRSRADR
ncbi:hypothetical protein MOQ72_34560 [Saccharopolyspora sp. K220]|uniref:hypothetical protein n=1 Tax=Saccharopolyspora soli TaxID=2926618 RepID=UPI001F5975B5|nr:hypothetical protein [Saccharopolyspora soli]MCI2422563.1 hypothetical protein [Saccharopolyspora soli]